MPQSSNWHLICWDNFRLKKRKFIFWKKSLIVIRDSKCLRLFDAFIEYVPIRVYNLLYLSTTEFCFMYEACDNEINK